MGQDKKILQPIVERICISADLAARADKFSLYFVECGLPEAQQVLLSQCEIECELCGLTVINCDFSDTIVDDLLEEVKSLTEERFGSPLEGPVALMVTGLEASMLLEDNPARSSLVQIMNMARERYAESFRCAVFIWLSSSLLRAVQKGAPDFCSWRKAQPFFIKPDPFIKEATQTLLGTPSGLNSYSKAVGSVGLIERLIDAYGDQVMDPGNSLELYSRLGDAYRFLKKFSKAGDCFKKALNKAEESNNLLAKADLLNRQGIILRETGRTGEALEFFKAHLSESRINLDKTAEYIALNNIGLAYLDKGDMDAAEEVLQKAIRLCDGISNLKLRSDAWRNSGLVKLSENSINEAISLFKKAEELTRSKPWTPRYSKDLMNLGVAEFRQHKWLEAALYYLFAAQVSHQIDDMVSKLDALIKLASCVRSGDLSDLKYGRFGVDRDYFQAWIKSNYLHSLQDEDALNPKKGEEIYRIFPEFMSEDKGMFFPASEYYKQAIRIARKIKDHESECLALIGLANSFEEKGDKNNAILWFETCLEQSREYGLALDELTSLCGLIRLHGRGEPDVTRNYIQQAQLFFEAHNKLKTVTIRAGARDPKGAFLGTVLEQGVPFRLTVELISDSRSYAVADKDNHLAIVVANCVQNLDARAGQRPNDKREAGKPVWISSSKQLRLQPTKLKTKRRNSFRQDQSRRQISQQESKKQQELPKGIHETIELERPVEFGRRRQLTAHQSKTVEAQIIVSQKEFFLDAVEPVSISIPEWQVDGPPGIDLWLKPEKLGPCRLRIACDINHVPYDLILSVNVVEKLESQTTSDNSIDKERIEIGKNRTPFASDSSQSEKARKTKKIQGSGKQSPALLEGQSVCHGKVKGLTILVEFADVRSDFLASDVDDLLNAYNYEGYGNFCSVRDYFRIMSNNKLDHTSNVVGPITLPKNREYYGRNGLMKDALELAIKKYEIELAEYDSMNRGVVDLISFLYAGGTEYRDWLWPHSSKMAYQNQQTKAERYIIQSLGRKNWGLNIGPLCNSIAQALCLFPSLFDYGNRDGDFVPSAGMGQYCLMSSGSYLNHGRTPSPVCGYLRDLAGWPSQEVLLNQGGQFEVIHGDYDKVFKFKTDLPNEYFIVENRSKMELDSYLPSSGLAVYHCDTKGSNEWQDGTPERHYQCALLQADGRRDLERNINTGDEEDLFKTASGIVLSNSTNPSTKMWDGRDSSLVISDIIDMGDRIKFTVG